MFDFNLGNEWVEIRGVTDRARMEFYGHDAGTGYVTYSYTHILS